MPSIEIVVCVSENLVIGIDNKMPWHISADLKHFKEITSTYPILMGKNTFLSIGRALPNRRNIVISKTMKSQDNIECVDSIESALNLVHDSPKIMIIGGGHIYKETLDLANVLHITVVEKTFNGDTYFPSWEGKGFDLVDKSKTFTDEKSNLKFHFETWKRS